MRTPPQVAIIVVSYNTRDLLLECLNSVVEDSYSTQTEIVVVDNASRDGSREAVAQNYPQAKLIANQLNLGFGAACNQAIRDTTAPFILLLNSDARLTSQALSALYNYMLRNHRCGAAGCRIINNEGRSMINTRYFLTPFNQALEQLGMTAKINIKYLRRTYRPSPNRENADCSVDWVDGACLMLRRAALDEIGLFDERFFMYSEDEDLCYRLRNQGWEICYSATATAVHHGAASASQDRFEMLFRFYSSQILFLHKHHTSTSTFFYMASMKTVLLLKILRAKLLRRDQQCEEFKARLRALRRAYSDRDAASLTSYH